MNIRKIEIPFGGKQIIIETGRMAKQANSSVVVTCGGTTVLIAVCMAGKAKEDAEFFPLTVEYQEKAYAAGKIPGGFFKREGRPTQKEILSSRLIDRPIRPLFPEGFYNDVVVNAHVLSSDGENDPDVLATFGASMALHISDIPFEGPIGPVRVCLVNDQFVVNPTYEQRTNTSLELFVVSTSQGIVMIEGEAVEVPEAKVIEGLKFAHQEAQALIKAQIEFQKEAGKPKAQVELFKFPPELVAKVREMVLEPLTKAYNIPDKMERENAIRVVAEGVLKDLTVFADITINDRAISQGHVKMILDQVEYELVRKSVFDKGIRADGRGLKDIRSISCEIEVLPRTHGTALFTRGQTQCLAIVTLGTKRDEQMVEGLQGLAYEDFMLHYNFPPFSVGEARMSKGPGRREIGHGALAAKAIKGILPGKDKFPYTIRIVSETLESNGSSSMASVCAGCLSLMDAGVPIKEMVAGISVGIMVDEKGKYKLMTDIMGLEDHFGDMDFKVAGSEKGITAIQLDLKIKSLDINILAEAMAQSRDARLFILGKMRDVISQPKPDTSEFAPRIVIVKIPQDKIGEVIGPGGRMIKKIIEETGTEAIDIDDDGTVNISGIGKEKVEKAKTYVLSVIEEPEVGRIYDAKVTRIMNFGAFCEFLPGREGLVHISELSNQFVKDINTVVKVGDTFKVKLVEIDKMKRLNLSKKQAEAQPEGEAETK